MFGLRAATRRGRRKIENNGENGPVCLRLIPVALLVFSAILAPACGSYPTDLRTVLPADALVYLESKDLGAAVRAVAESDAVRQHSASMPDLSVIDGIELAVAVTGFETSEQQLTEEASVLNFQPRFVAVAETRLWNFQVIAFTEEHLGAFINDVYGGEVLLETSDKHTGKSFVWTARDGRKAYAYVEGSLIFFGNDETAIERALAVKRGEAESIARNPKIVGGERLAFGYIAPDGVAQIANIAGISLAKRSGDEPEVQSFIARVLPEMLRNSLREVTWTATATEKGIEDRYTIATDPEIAAVLRETLGPSADPASGLNAYIPNGFVSATRYDLQDARIGWRSVLLTAQKVTDEVSGGIIAAFSGSLFEPYGIDDPEGFLAVAASPIYTVRFDADGEQTAAIVRTNDVEKLKLSLAKELDFRAGPGVEGDFSVWRSAENDIAAAFSGEVVIVGEPGAVLRCIQANQQGRAAEHFADPPSAGGPVSKTAGFDADTARAVITVLSGQPPATNPEPAVYLTETRFDQKGAERRTVSQFGLIGMIIAQFAGE
jgi:hypothetical protein